MRTIHAIHGCCSEGTPTHVGPAACCGVARRFSTKEERREALESYREELKKELTGVEERLDELR
jgi:hypothetical protein